MDATTLQGILTNPLTSITIIVAIIIGVALGLKNIIVVYRDYDDMAISFLLVLAPIILIFLLSFAGNMSAASVYFIAIVEICILIWLFARTLSDNSNKIVFTLIAIVTKIALSVLFVVNLLQLVDPSGKTRKQRASSRGIAFTILLVVSPLIFSLVRNKVGIINPARTLARKGISI